MSRGWRTWPLRPVHVSLFGSQAIVFVMQNLPKLIQQPGRLGNIGDGFHGQHQYCSFMQSTAFSARPQVAFRHIGQGFG